MKRMMFRNESNPSQGTKSLAIITRQFDSNCKTTVVKKFKYDVFFANDKKEETSQPIVHIRKNIDNQRKVEWFHFDVEGQFFMKHKRHLMLVKFHHSLKIKIQWTTKQLSSKKSEVLT